MPSARKPILSDSPSATTPRTIGTRSARWRFVQDTSGSESTSISPFAPSFESALHPPLRPPLRVGAPLQQLLRRRLAHRHGPRGDAAHHHALENGLATYARILLGLPRFHRVHRIGGQPMFLSAAHVSSLALSASELSAMVFSASASSLTSRLHSGPRIATERCSPGASEATVTVSTVLPSTVRRTGTALAAALP